MPIEIRELVVRASVNSTHQPDTVGELTQIEETTTAPVAPLEFNEEVIEEIVERCVDQVFRVLEEERER